jgi:hypothetical protein
MQSTTKVTPPDYVVRVFGLAAKEIPNVSDMLDAVRRSGELAQAIQCNVLSESQPIIVKALISSFDAQVEQKP